MTGDECTCGICELDCCDRCGSTDGLTVDPFNEAYCRSCFENLEHGRNEAAAEREAQQWHGGSDWMGAAAYRRQMQDAGRR